MKKLKKSLKGTGNAVEAYACACLCACVCSCSCGLFSNKTTQSTSAQSRGSSKTAEATGMTRSV